MASNKELGIRRSNLRPRRSQGDMRRAIHELTGEWVSVSRISDWENDEQDGDEIANGVMRQTYQTILEAWEIESSRTFGGSK